jgi:S-DNA-T family DNA segregation ATPase FtsK/SpoIIIE
LTGHAAGEESLPVLDRAAVAKAIGSGTAERAPIVELPEPLASVIAYLDGSSDREPGCTFIPTAELVTALDIERTTLSRQLGDLGCRPTRVRIPTDDGTLRQVRGYLTADIRAAADTIRHGNAEVGNGDG